MNNHTHARAWLTTMFLGYSESVMCEHENGPVGTPTGTIILVSVQNTTSRNEQGGGGLFSLDPRILYQAGLWPTQASD